MVGKRPRYIWLSAQTVTCKTRALHNFKNLRLDSLGLPTRTPSGKDGSGKGKAVVGSDFDCRVEKQKVRRRFQAKSDLDCKIHRGKQMAQVVKLIVSRRGFGSSPSGDETAGMLWFLAGSASATPPPLPELDGHWPLEAAFPPPFPFFLGTGFDLAAASEGWGFELPGAAPVNSRCFDRITPSSFTKAKATVTHLWSAKGLKARALDRLDCWRLM